MYCPTCGSPTSLDGPCAACGGTGTTTSAASPSQARPLTDLPLLDVLITPLQDKDALHRIGVGCVVSLIPFIGQIWLLGYALRWTRRLISEGDRRLPEWDDWGGLFTEGMWASVVTGVFWLVPFGVLTVLAVPKSIAWISLMLSGHLDPLSTIVNVVMLLVASAAIITICSLPAPLALCLYARSGNVMTAIQPRAWGGLIAQAPLEFFGCWAAIIAATVAVGIAGASLNAVPLLGQLCAFLLGLALTVVAGLSVQAVFARYVLRHGGRALGE